MRLLRFGVFFLLATAVFAQRGGMRGGGSSGGRSGGSVRGFSGGRSFGGGGFRSSPGIRSGSGFRSNPGFRGSSGYYRRPSYGSSRYAFSFGFGGYGYYPGFYDYGYPYYAYGYGYPGYGYSYGYPSYGYSYPYYAYSYDQPYYEPATVVNQSFRAPAAPPQQYSTAQPSSEAVYREPIYLIAFRDHTIQAAIAYWVEGDTLHLVTREHEQKQIPLVDIDRSFSEQLNRDRRVEFHLPR